MQCKSDRVSSQNNEAMSGDSEGIKVTCIHLSVAFLNSKPAVNEYNPSHMLCVNIMH